jgi:hypothetical protein
VALFVTLVVVLVILAATYQPLGSGGSEGGPFPGLPLGTPGRFVNQFAGATGELFFPPQRGNFTILASLENSGSRAVTVQAVTFVAPGAVGDWPLVPAGPVLYMPGEYARHQRVWRTGRPVKGLSLGPGESIVVGIQVRMADSCYVSGGGWSTDQFWVQERYLTFTHWVAIPLEVPVLMREPEPAGAGAGLVCLK